MATNVGLPRIARKATRCLKLLTAAMTQVSAPQSIIIPDKKSDGRIQLRSRLSTCISISSKTNFETTYLLGTSNTTYPIKKTTKEMEYSFDVRFRSVSMPEIFAFPILPACQWLFPVKGGDILGPVHVGQQVHDPYHGQENQIDLPDQGFFLFRSVKGGIRAGILNLFGADVLFLFVQINYHHEQYRVCPNPR